jgi:hypothetical protein
MQRRPFLAVVKLEDLRGGSIVLFHLVMDGRFQSGNVPSQGRLENFVAKISCLCHDGLVA